jgi:hypothetical protein
MSTKEQTRKRLEKRHSRHVSRAKAGATVSEPDVRTPEQLAAAREASRPAASRGKDPSAHYTNPAIRSQSKTPTKAGGE